MVRGLGAGDEGGAAYGGAELDEAIRLFRRFAAEEAHGEGIASWTSSATAVSGASEQAGAFATDVAEVEGV